MNRLSRFLLAGATLLALACTFAPAGAYAADVADNAQIMQLTPNGDWVPTQFNFNSNSAGQDITVQSTGALGLNPVTKGNLASSVIPSGSAVSLVTATPKTVTSVTLTVGTWRLYAYVDYVLAAATTTLIQQGFATTTNSFTNSLQTQDVNTTLGQVFTTATLTLTGQPTPWQQITVATGTQVVFLVAQATFSAGAVTAYGTLYPIQIK